MTPPSLVHTVRPRTPGRDPEGGPAITSESLAVVAAWLAERYAPAGCARRHARSRR